MIVTDRNYAVGRGKPPPHARFKPGQSGNPGGRPKPLPTFRSELVAELGELVPSVGERITKQRAIAQKLLTSALAGDLRAITVLLTVLGRTPEADSDELTEVDEAILQGLKAREGAGRSPDSGTKGQA
jgi:hypothetical protein